MGFNIENFLRNIDGEARRRVNLAAIRAVDQFAEHVVGKAQKLAPVDTGALQNSGVAGAAEMHGNQVNAVVGFNTSYAAAVHERLDIHHPNGQAKFLESAMRTQARKLTAFVQDEIAKAL